MSWTEHAQVSEVQVGVKTFYGSQSNKAWCDSYFSAGNGDNSLVYADIRFITLSPTTWVGVIPNSINSMTLF